MERTENDFWQVEPNTIDVLQFQSSNAKPFSNSSTESQMYDNQEYLNSPTQNFSNTKQFDENPIPQHQLYDTAEMTIDHIMLGIQPPNEGISNTEVSYATNAFQKSYPTFQY